MKAPVRYVAFLRAINVGGHVVKMDALKRIFAKEGFANVETFIASGNVEFEAVSTDAAALERRIGAALEKALGYEVATFLRTPAELSAIAAYRPFKGVDDGPAYLVGLLHAPLSAALVKRLMALASDYDRFHVRGREVWWYSDIRQGESKFSNAVFEKALGVRSTWRNLRTIRKMAERWG